MRLKSITLNGFKTFATKTEFEFDDQVTVIVGPNGSGKSNIADAVRWVLGEQSYKLLRGKKTVDMIFHGSDERARAGMASATIVFDNSDGWLPIDFSEVSITRRAYRDGKNEYLINGQQVLLRDVNELLGKSGLAERTYTIIGQGLVDAALALNADERRSLFEEAAGIGLYRSRREDAEKRLDKTRRNLDRVEDILSELKPRLRSLERQAKRANKFDQVRADLKALMREWYGYHWYRVQGELSRARQQEKEQRIKLEKARREQSQLDRDLAECQADLQGLRARLNTWHRELSEQHARREESSREHAVVMERIRSLENQQAEMETELTRLHEQKKSRGERLEGIQAEATELEEERDRAQGKLQQFREQFAAQEEKRHSLEGQLAQAREDLARERQHLSRLAARKEERRDVIQTRQQQLADMDEEINRVDDDLSAAKEKLREARENRDEIREERRDLEKKLDQNRQEIQSGERYLRRLQEQLSALEAESSRTKAELDVLKQAEDKLAGYAEGTRVLLENAGKGRLSGAVGALSSNLEVPEKYETAVAAALGEYLDAVVLEKGVSVDRALSLLVEEAARGALLPLDSLTPPEPLTPNGDLPGVIGVASRLVDGPPKLRPAIDLLLGQVILVEEKKDVRRALSGQPQGARAVTLAGEVYFGSGQIYAGQDGQVSTLSRSRQKRNWQEKLESLHQKGDQLQKKIADVRSRIKDRREQEESLMRKVEEKLKQQEQAEEAYNQAVLTYEAAGQQAGWVKSRQDGLEEEIQKAKKEIIEIENQEKEREDQTQRLEKVIDDVESQLQEINLSEEREKISAWKTEVAVTERALADVRERLAERKESWEDVSQNIAQLRERKQSIMDEIKALRAKKAEWKNKEDKIEERIEEIRELIRESEAELEKKEEQQTRLQKEEAQARKVLNQTERAYAQAEVALTRAEDDLERMEERIREDIGLVEYDYDDDMSGPTPLPLEGYVEKLPKKKSIPEDFESNIKSLRRQMRRLGAVNPEAQDEYQQVQERYQFLTEQLSDLRKAESDIKEVIAELEVLMEREFRKTFDEVAGEFRKIFVRLFGGGEGRLVLSDPEDLSRSGVEIEARLPGRRTQGLSLLSGGERSLTAAALIFSLIKVSTTPFCVLDEVDAMLDESNVARYRELLRELSAETQFIVITHNRNTVQVADVLYGITMAEDSTSRVLSLKLDQVEEIIA